MGENGEETVERTGGARLPGRFRGQVLPWILQILRDLAETVVPAIVIALAINLFLAQATQVLGQSMEPNLHTYQRVVVEKVTYRFLHGPQRGDVIVIDLPDHKDMLIKRVIGLPGETIEMRSGQVFIDGVPIEEPWMPNFGGNDFGPRSIPPLHVFAMGDNRGASNDSRNFGPVHVDWILGHAWFSYWPLNMIGFIQ